MVRSNFNIHFGRWLVASLIYVKVTARCMYVPSHRSTVYVTVRYDSSQRPTFHPLLIMESPVAQWFERPLERRSLIPFCNESILNHANLY